MGLVWFGLVLTQILCSLSMLDLTELGNWRLLNMGLCLWILIIGCLRPQ